MFSLSLCRLCKALFYYILSTYAATGYLLGNFLFKQNFQLTRTFMASKRAISVENPYIEDVLDKYCGIPHLAMLALGSSYWTPPKQALDKLSADIFNSGTQRYGSILGLNELRDKLKQQLMSRGLSMDDMELVMTPGGNQAFVHTTLLLCDSGDHAIVLAPYYFCHMTTLQMCQAEPIVCPFIADTLEPSWKDLEEQLEKYKPKMVVLTSPNNPSGYVWSESQLERIIALCKRFDVWLIVDQTYHDITHDNTKHVYPCGKKFNYDKIIHIFSFSKTFAMPGWRVGYFVFPKHLMDNVRKIQDTIPTHPTILSQKLALYCLETFDSNGRNPWLEEHLNGLKKVRELLWPILEPLGTVKTHGAFYFMVPLPPHVSEEEAVDILAKQFGVLLMHGAPFGAKGHLRCSYGSIPPDQIVENVEKLKNGFEYLVNLSKERSK